jgi:hypothetical protein
MICMNIFHIEYKYRFVLHNISTWDKNIFDNSIQIIIINIVKSIIKIYFNEFYNHNCPTQTWIHTYFEHIEANGFMYHTMNIYMYRAFLWPSSIMAYDLYHYVNKSSITLPHVCLWSVHCNLRWLYIRVHVQETWSLKYPLTDHNSWTQDWT